MARLRIAWRFAADYGTMTSNTETFEREPENLLNPQLSYDYQTSTAGTSEWLKVDLGQSENITFFCLYGHNFDNTETGKYIEGAGSDSWGSPTFQQAITHRASHFIEFFSQQTLRWWRMPWTKAAAADERTAQRFLLGTYTELGRNPSFGGLGAQGKDTSIVVSGRDGQRYSDGGARLKQVKVSLRNCSASDADELQELWDTNGTTTPFLLSENHDINPIDGLLYGNMTEFSREPSEVDGAGDFLYNVDFSMIEQK